MGLVAVGAILGGCGMSPVATRGRDDVGVTGLAEAGAGHAEHQRVVAHVRVVAGDADLPVAAAVKGGMDADGPGIDDLSVAGGAHLGATRAQPDPACEGFPVTGVALSFTKGWVLVLPAQHVRRIAAVGRMADDTVDLLSELTAVLRLEPLEIVTAETEIRNGPLEEVLPSAGVGRVTVEARVPNGGVGARQLSLDCLLKIVVALQAKGRPLLVQPNGRSLVGDANVVTGGAILPGGGMD